MSKPPKCVLLFDMTRNRSHLFFRFLSTHPEIQSCWHPFLTAFLFGPERITQHIKRAGSTTKQADPGWDAMLSDETYSDAAKKFLSAFEKAQRENKVFVANEHCQMVLKQDVALAMIRNEKVPKLSNLTEIPDSVFDILKPVFIIRNPVFSIPSNYVSLGKTSDIRPGDEAWDLMTGTPLQRHLFDLFRERDGHPPLVFDGDDVVWNTEEMGRKICEALNLDPSGISEKWEAKPEAERSSDPLIRHFLLDSDNSTGIIRGTHAPPDGNLERAYETWVAKFGEDAAKVLEQRAQRNMVDYEYLKQYAQ